MRTSDEVHLLELIPMTPESWRVCDRAVASSDAASVVAYVERGAGDDAYDVVWVAGAAGVETFTSLEGVLRAATELLAGEPRPRAPRPIALLRPPIVERGAKRQDEARRTTLAGDA